MSGTGAEPMTSESMGSGSMGSGDVLVIVSQDFILAGKDLYQASSVLMDFLSRACRGGVIVDGYAGPARDTPVGAGGDPDDLGGGILTVRVEVVAGGRDAGASVAVEVLHRGFHALGTALPDQYTADEIQLLTIAIGGDGLHVTCLDRDAAYRRAGITR